MTAYSSQIDMALDLIQEKGQKITLTRQGDAGDYDPIEQTETEVPAATHNLYGVILPPGKSRDFVEGSLIGRDVAEAWVAAKGATVTPARGDVITANGKARTVFHVVDYEPDGTPIVWKLYVEA